MLSHLPYHNSKVNLVHLLSFLLVFIMFPGCRKKVVPGKDEKAILEIIDNIHTAHLNKDAEAFYADYADRWIDVRNGRIDTLEKMESVKKSQGYLNNMTFIDLKFLHPPLVRISDDATLADFIGSVLVRGYYEEAPVFWTASWQNTLEQDNAEWRIISAVNTDGDNHYNAQIWLEEMRVRWGGADTLVSIMALANCKGPEYSFTTLIHSSADQGRMEQKTPNAHYVLKHGTKTSWSVDLKRGDTRDSIDGIYRTFLKGHELHWIAFRPDTRYSAPVLAEAKKIKDKWVMPIQLKDDLGFPIIVYYDFETYKPLSLNIQTDEQGNTVNVTFEGWTRFDGLEIFTKAIFDQGGDLFTYHYEDVKINHPESAVQMKSMEPILNRVK